MNIFGLILKKIHTALEASSLVSKVTVPQPFDRFWSSVLISARIIRPATCKENIIVALWHIHEIWSGHTREWSGNTAGMNVNRTSTEFSKIEVMNDCIS